MTKDNRKNEERGSNSQINPKVYTLMVTILQENCVIKKQPLKFFHVTKGTSKHVLNHNLVLVSAPSTSSSVFLVHICDYQRSHQFLRANAAAIPPATSPTAVAAIPMPITPSFLIRSSIAFLRDCACLHSGSIFKQSSTSSLLLE